MRRWNVRLGDKTTAGGVVLEGEPSATCEGEQLSYSGARIHCPACNSTGQGLAIPPYHFMTFNGNQALMDGDLCICQCNPPPRLIASQTSMGMLFESSDIPAPTNSTLGAVTTAAAAGAFGNTQAHDETLDAPEPKPAGKQKHVTRAQGQANIDAARRAILAAWDHGDFPEFYYGNHMKMRMDEFRTEKLTYEDRDNYSDIYGFQEGAHTHLDAYGWAGEMEFFRGSADTREDALETVSHEFTHTLRSFVSDWLQAGRAYNRSSDVAAFRVAAEQVHTKMGPTVKGIYSKALPYLTQGP